MENINLVELAKNARKMSYSKYSGFAVGSALLTKSGVVYTGCNVENASYSLTNCAERTAFFKAVSDGKKDFEAIAIVGGDIHTNEYGKCVPCGACMQVMSEFCDDQFKIILCDSNDGVTTITLKDLMPYRFELLEK